MDTTTQPTPPGSMLRFTLDKKTLEMHMELNALLTSFGAPIDLARVAVSTWEHDLQIVDDTASKSRLYSLPVRLIPAFIDQILGELSTESRAMAIQLRDSFRKCEASASLLTSQSNSPEILDVMRLWMKGAPAMYALYTLFATQFKRSAPAGSNAATDGAQ